MSADVSGYISDGEITVSTLLNRGEGTLHVLRKSGLWEHIQAFLPKSSSAFDSNKVLMQASYQALNDRVKEFMIRSHLLRYQGIESSNDQFVNKMVARIAELVLKQGINKANRLELQWAAAQGPWPSWTRKDQHFSSMQGAYYLLVEIAEITFQNKRLARYVIQDISHYLSKAWDGIGTWLH